MTSSPGRVARMCSMDTMRSARTDDGLDTFMVRVYLGELDAAREFVSIEGTKETSADEVIAKVVHKLRLGLQGQYELAEAFCSGGQLCKERRLEPAANPVRIQLLWPRIVQRDSLHHTEYCFFLRKKEPDKQAGGWVEYSEPSPIDTFLSAFLQQHKSKEYPDLCNLPDLNENTLLDNLRKRFYNDHIYTYVGSILIAVNPFKFYPIYNPKYVRMYQNHRMGDLPPHIFAIADVAYHRMLKEKTNQCIVISGESGSGKTESTNFLLHHLSALSHKGVHSTGIEQIILSAGPVLEAFGNAKTLHNNNSSRFGKFIQVNYKENGMVHGAILEKYLLEKSRIVAQAQDERNYHVFYYLLSGASPEELDALSLSKAEDFHYLSQSNCFTLEGIDGEPVDEGPEFARLRQAMENVGFSTDTQKRIFSVLAAVLHLGNIKFKKKHDRSHHHDGVSIGNMNEVHPISDLLKVKESMLVQALTSRKTVVGGETVIMGYNMATATAARDGMAKCLYAALFDWIVLQINRALLSKRDLKSQQGCSIGVLDIFGFEDFHNNSFEQFCINYANEDLQYYFNQHIFKFEQEEYVREGIQWKNIEYIDNTGCLELFSGKKHSLLFLLDEESNFLSGTNETLLNRFHTQHANNTYYEVPQMREDAFIIVHYAGKVKYNIQDFREKNLDQMRPDIMLVLKNSCLTFVRELVGVDPVAVLRWSILRAFFRCLFAFKQAGAQRKDREDMPDKTASPKSGVIARRTPERGGRKDPSLHLYQVIFAFNALKRIQKSKSFKPKTRYLRGLKDLQSMKTVATRVTGQKTNKAKGKTPSVSAQFNVSLAKLKDTLNNAKPFFIRCIKSNSDKCPCKFDKECVLRQLRYTGMLATVKIRQSGYNYRLTFEEFIQMYKILLPHQSRSSRGDVEEFLCSLDLNQENYQIGKTKVFLRETEKMLLDDSLHQAFLKRIITIQRWYQARATWRRYQRMKKAALLIQRNVRGLLARRRVQEMRTLLYAAIRIQCLFRGYRVRKQLQRQHDAATVIQAMYRGYRAQQWYTKVKEAVVLIQALFRGGLARTRYRALVKAKQKAEEEERQREKEREEREREREKMRICDTVAQSSESSRMKGEAVSTATPHPGMQAEDESSAALHPAAICDENKDDVDGVSGSKMGRLEVTSRGHKPLGPTQSVDTIQGLRYQPHTQTDNKALSSTGSHHVAASRTRSADPTSAGKPSLSRSVALPIIRSKPRRVSPDKLKKTSLDVPSDSGDKEALDRKRSLDSLREGTEKPKVDVTRAESPTPTDASPVKTPKMGRRLCKFRGTLPAEKDFLAVSKSNSLEGLSPSPTDLEGHFKAEEGSPKQEAAETGKSEDSLSSSGIASAVEGADLNSCTSDVGILTKEPSAEELLVDKDTERSQMSEGSSGILDDSEPEQNTLLLPGRGRAGSLTTPPVTPTTLYGVADTVGMLGPEVAARASITPGPEVIQYKAFKFPPAQSRDIEIKIKPAIFKSQSAESLQGQEAGSGKPSPRRRVVAPIAKQESFDDYHIPDVSVITKNLVLPTHPEGEEPLPGEPSQAQKGQGEQGSTENLKGKSQFRSPFHKAKKQLKNIMDSSSSLDSKQDTSEDDTTQRRWSNILRRKSFGKSSSTDLGSLKPEENKAKASRLSLRSLLNVEAWSGKKHGKKDTTDESDEEGETTPQPSPSKAEENIQDPFHRFPGQQDSKKRRLKRRGSKKKRDNKDRDEHREDKQWNVAGTAKEDYPDHVVIKDKPQLQQFEFFITSKISEYQQDSSRRDTVFDVVFKKALAGFHKTIITHVASASETSKLNITYKDVMLSFEDVLRDSAEKLTSDVSFPVTLGLNAFRGFLDEFQKKSQSKELPDFSKTRKVKRKLDRGTTIKHRGHQFVVTQFSIATYCEYCSGYVWLMEKGLLCQVCKYTLHRKCMEQSKVSCRGAAHQGKKKVKHIFGAPLAAVVDEENRPPEVIEKILQSIELNGLYTVGLYRKPGPIARVKQLVKEINNDPDKADIRECLVHTLTTVVKQFFRDLPEPLMTFELYDDLCRIAECKDEHERVSSVLSLVSKLPAPNFGVLERLIFHLAKIAMHESSNKMSPNGLAIIFAPTILKSNKDMPAQESLMNVPRQTVCIECLISQQMKKIKQVITDIKTLDTATLTAENRLSVVRQSRRSKRQTASGEAAGPSSPSIPEEDDQDAEEEFLLTQQIESLKKEKEVLTVQMPTLEQRHSSSEDDMLSGDDLDSTGDELEEMENEEECAVTFDLPASPPKVLGQVQKHRAPAPHRRRPSRLSVGAEGVTTSQPPRSPRDKEGASKSYPPRSPRDKEGASKSNLLQSPRYKASGGSQGFVKTTPLAESMDQRQATPPLMTKKTRKSPPPPDLQLMKPPEGSSEPESPKPELKPRQPKIGLSQKLSDPVTPSSRKAYPSVPQRMPLTNKLSDSQLSRHVAVPQTQMPHATSTSALPQHRRSLDTLDRAGSTSVRTPGSVETLQQRQASTESLPPRQTLLDSPQKTQRAIDAQGSLDTFQKKPLSFDFSQGKKPPLDSPQRRQAGSLQRKPASLDASQKPAMSPKPLPLSSPTRTRGDTSPRGLTSPVSLRQPPLPPSTPPHTPEAGSPRGLHPPHTPRQPLLPSTPPRSPEGGPAARGFHPPTPRQPLQPSTPPRSPDGNLAGGFPAPHTPRQPLHPSTPTRTREGDSAGSSQPPRTPQQPLPPVPDEAGEDSVEDDNVPQLQPITSPELQQVGDEIIV